MLLTGGQQQTPRSEHAGQKAEPTDPQLLSGSLWVTLTVHAKRAFADPQVFRELRGTSEFSAFVHNLRHCLPLRSYEPDESAPKVLSSAYRAGVFNQHFVQQELVPVYKYRGHPFLDEISPADARAKRQGPTNDWTGEPYQYPFHLSELIDKKARLDLQDALRKKLQTKDPLVTKARERHPQLLQDDMVLVEKVLDEGLRDVFFPLVRELQTRWQLWKKWLLLTRYGYFQIWLRREFQDLSDTEVLEEALQLNRQLEPAQLLEQEAKRLKGLNQQSRDLEFSPEAQLLLLALPEISKKWRRSFEAFFQWEIARILIDTFLQDCLAYCEESKDGPLRFAPDFSSSWYTDHEVRLDQGGIDLPLRWKHTVFHINKVAPQVSPQSPAYVEKTEGVLVGLLEGVPVATRKHQQGDYRRDDYEPIPREELEPLELPSIRTTSIKEALQHNRASWNGEIFLVTGDSSLLSTMNEDQAVLYFDDTVTYSAYWKSILRGLAHLCEMRLMTRQLRVETADLLERSLHRDQSPAEASYEARVAALLLARARSATDAANMARGDYAVDKFRRIGEVFDIPAAIEAVQHNLELVDNAISQDENLTLERSQFLLSIILGTFTVVTIALALPPFWDSASKAAKDLSEAPGWYITYKSFVDIGVTVLSVATLLLAPVFFYFAFRRPAQSILATRALDRRIRKLRDSPQGNFRARLGRVWGALKR